MTLYTLTIKDGRKLAMDDPLISHDPTHEARNNAARSLWLYLMTAAVVAASISYPIAQYRHADVSQPFEKEPAHWTKISEPIPLYALQTKVFGDIPSQYSARRLGSGFGRSDRLTFGDLHTASAYFELQITRLREDAPALPRSITDAKFLATGKIENSFGTLNYAVVNARKGPQRQCLQFRLHRSSPALYFGGIACPQTHKTNLSPQDLACLLQRLNLKGAGDDRALRKYFVAAELHQDQFCNGKYYVGAAKQEL